MNHQTKTNTPETATLASMQRTHQEWQAHGERLERERDDAKFDADDESRWAMSYKTQRDEALAQLREERQLHVQTLNERDEARASLAAAQEWSAVLADVGDDFRALHIEMRNAVRNLRDARGDRHAKRARDLLFGLLMGSSQP